MNLFDQRFANNGNQFSVEPPDQGLCVGNGYVIESVNDVLRIMDTGGNTLRTVDLNTFYGYAPAIDRTKNPLQYGPSITDPTCLYDADTGRFFQVVLTLDRANPGTTALSGNNHLDIAVSDSGNALGSWTIYRLPVQNNGTQGTPNHHCNNGFCLGDYPHIGADATGFYMTTNEFAVSGPGFYGAQIYAVSKRALANGTAKQVFLFNTGELTMPDGVPGFTVWPAQSPGQNTLANGGTEYLLSSDAVFFGESDRIAVWSITNTASLDTATPAPALSGTYQPVTPYAIPGKSTQKTGNLPLRDCIADIDNSGCPAKIGTTKFNNSISRLDSNDSRMQQVSYANGKLWASWGTGLTFDNGKTAVAGLTYVVFDPTTSIVSQNGYIGLQGNNLTYGAVAVTRSGRGVVGFTLVGPDYFPSAGYTSLDAKVGVGDIHVAGPGAGPWDGFTGYRPFSTRPRWGDYGSAAVDGDSIWLANEWVAQTCTYADYNISGPGFGTCGGTRAPLGNWSTRISKLSTK